MSYKLVRLQDNLIKQSQDRIFIEFDDNGKFKAKHTSPAIGYSLLLSPFNQFFTWQTSTITQIISEDDDLVHFKTNNSEYKLYNLDEAYRDLTVEDFVAQLNVDKFGEIE